MGAVEIVGLLKSEHGFGDVYLEGIDDKEMVVVRAGEIRRALCIADFLREDGDLQKTVKSIASAFKIWLTPQDQRA